MEDGTITGRALFYPVWISTHAGQGRSPICWGPPCDTIGEATDLGHAEVKAGNASVSFVVRIGPECRDVCHERTRPMSAKKIVMHLLDVEQALDDHE